MIAELEFNFVRLPLDYQNLTMSPDWVRCHGFDEKRLKLIDRTLAEVKEFGVHVNLCFQRILG